MKASILHVYLLQNSCFKYGTYSNSNTTTNYTAQETASPRPLVKKGREDWLHVTDPSRWYINSVGSDRKIVLYYLQGFKRKKEFFRAAETQK